MLARLRTRLMVFAMVGTAWLGSYMGCDTGGRYSSFGGAYETFGGVYDTVGGYFWADDYYYAEPVWDGGYVYDPYSEGYYYDGYDGYDGGYGW